MIEILFLATVASTMWKLGKSSRIWLAMLAVMFTISLATLWQGLNSYPFVVAAVAIGAMFAGNYYTKEV